VAGTLNLVQDGGVTHLGAAFDTVIRSFRNDLFPGYKTEAGVPADLLAQFPIAEEGLEQRHCIGSYVNACSSGASRVFSLRQHGKRTATLELQRNHDGAWRRVQIRGKANAVVHDPALLAAADQVAQAYTDAARAHEQMERGPAEPGSYVPPPYLVHRQEHWTG